MRRFALIAAMVLASATAQAGESRSLSVPTGNDQTATVHTQPATSDVRAENTTTSDQPAEQPRYIAPAADTDTTPSNQPSAETPRYTARPAVIDNKPPATTTTTRTPSDDTTYRPSRTRHARAERPHGRGHWSTGRIIATLHRYGVYW
jgi:hypothetical protein